MLYPKLNDTSKYSLFADKTQALILFKDYILRDWISTKDCSKEQIYSFIRDHTKLIVKPISGSQGLGVHLYKEGEDLSKGDYLIEEYIEQHSLLSSFNPSTVNTIRIYTLINKIHSTQLSDINVQFLSLSIRVGGIVSDVDNYHAGGVGYPIDLETGVIYNVGTNIKSEKFIFHPSTNVKVVGCTIPHWDRFKDYIISLCSIVPFNRCTAWDLAVTPTGFDLVEVNHEGNSGFIQSSIQEGRLRIIKAQL